MVTSFRVLALGTALFAVLCLRLSTLQADTPSTASLASITVDLQTFGRPKADFPATIQIHSSALESDLSSTSEKPSSLNFPNLPPGQYVVSVTAPSREPAHLELTLAGGQSAKLLLIVDRIFPLTLNLDSATAALVSSVALDPAPSAAATVNPPSSSPSPSTPRPAPVDATASDESQPSSASPPASSFADIPASLEPGDSSVHQPFVGSCSADEVVPHVSAHVQQFVESINRITATESMNFERRNKKGRFEEEAKTRATYVAMIQPLDNGFLAVEEYRNGASGMNGIEGHIASTGSVALVLIFHPIHLHEFEMSCKGLTYWRNRAVYEIAFQQRSDVPNTMSEFRVGHISYDILLKGTAFIDADTFQIVHLDTDIARPIPDILDFEHQAVDYGAVSFATHDDQLWLPQIATITVRFRNKEFLERHAYSDYRLFTVDTGQKISKPAVPADPNAPSPN